MPRETIIDAAIRLLRAHGTRTTAQIAADVVARGLSRAKDPAASVTRQIRWDPRFHELGDDRWILARPVANERRVGLPPRIHVLPRLRPPVAQPDWVSRFGVALEVHRFAEHDGMSTTVRAIEARRLVEGLTRRMSAEGIPMPDLNATGDECSSAFDRWLVESVVWLRAPSRG